MDAMADEPVTPAAPAADPAAPAATPDPAPAPSGESLPPSLTADPAESKPAADPAKPPEGDKPADAKPSPTIPEKYDFSALKLPEGVTLHADIVGAIEPVFKKHGLTQEAASELVQAHADALAKVQTDAETKAETDFQTWMAEQAREHDKAIRKEWGADYDANFKVAQRGLARFFQDKDLYRVLDETGLARQPAFMKGLLQVGKLIQEDTPPNGAHLGGRKSDAELFYGTSSH